jgi:hypothetical protein
MRRMSLQSCQQPLTRHTSTKNVANLPVEMTRTCMVAELNSPPPDGTKQRRKVSLFLTTAIHLSREARKWEWKFHNPTYSHTTPRPNLHCRMSTPDTGRRVNYTDLLCTAVVRHGMKPAGQGGNQSNANTWKSQNERARRICHAFIAT